MLADLVDHARSQIERLSQGVDDMAPCALLDRLAAIQDHLCANSYSSDRLYEAMLMMRDIATPLASLVVAIAGSHRDAGPGPNGPP